jgi:hypothetical protein
MALASDYYQGVAPGGGTAAAGNPNAGTGGGMMSGPVSANVNTNVGYQAGLTFGGSAGWIFVLFAGLALVWHLTESR